MVPISEDWLQNREMIQTKAHRLLTRRSSNPEFRAHLLELIVNPEHIRTPAYHAKIETSIDLTIKLIIQLDRLLTPKQRSYLLKRIESLAADFDKLSCDPREVPRVQGSKVQGSGFKGSEVQGSKVQGSGFKGSRSVGF